MSECNDWSHDKLVERIASLEAENKHLNDVIDHTPSLQMAGDLARAETERDKNNIQLQGALKNLRDVAAERDELVKEVFQTHRLREASKSAVVDTVGGVVDGAPTKTINYLQRLRELVKAEAERDELREVMETLAQIVWDGCDIDGGDFQDLLEKKGLLVTVPASEEFASEFDTDTMFALKWSPLAREVNQHE